MKLSIYQAVLKTYARQQGITLEQALKEAIEQSSGKPGAEGQIEQYRRAFQELEDRNE